uniref:Transmembrane protein n=1 Tax=Steinernema glaseri TaxID=37863 RepID=A0A1I7Z3R2_9BILA
MDEPFGCHLIRITLECYPQFYTVLFIKSGGRGLTAKHLTSLDSTYKRSATRPSTVKMRLFAVVFLLFVMAAAVFSQDPAVDNSGPDDKDD